MTTIPMPLMNKLMTQSPTRKLLAIAICGLGTLSVTTAPVYADDDGSFWTQFVPSADTRLIFVSSEEGNDNNSGLNPNAPVKTLARGYELLRDGYPDWMLLKRGDVWYESFPRWGKSGRSEIERTIVGAYGEGTNRPQIRPAGGSNGLNGHSNNTVEHVAFVGFHLEPHNRVPGESAKGVSWLKDAEDVVFEDIYIDGFSTNISLQALGDGVSLRDFKLNGCIIVDAWDTEGHSQGLFAKGVNGLIIENCVFDHNGWNLDASAEPTTFNHNAYIQYTCSDVTVVNNVFSRAAGSAVQMRAGGRLENNLFLLNPVSFAIGSPDGYNLGYGVDAVVRNNAILHGTAMQNSNNTPSSIGMYIHNANEIFVSGNIFAFNEIDYNGQPIRISGSDNGSDPAIIDISNNSFFAWQGSVTISDEQTASLGDNISVHGNLFVFNFNANDGVPSFNKSIINLSSSASYAEFANNSYQYFGMHNAPFKNGSSLSVENWKRLHEPTGVFEELPSRPSGLDLASYQDDMNVDGDAVAFINTARSLSRTNSVDDTRPSTVYNWLQNRLQPYTGH